ncbi:MAG: hypothetical protein U1E40_10305 [Amaricoccus sp.]
MTPARWATVRDRAVPKVRATIDAVFARTPTPVPYDILNEADTQNLGHAYWALAVFGLLPLEKVPYGYFPYSHVNALGRVVMREHIHEQHYQLFAETRPAGWTPVAEIIR